MSQDFTKVVDRQYSLRVDEVSSTLMYVAEAAPGVLDASPSWRIKRIRFLSTETIIEWADGNQSFDNIYDDRASLTYS